MKQSLTYYITLLVLKLKGLKKDFSKDPIDFKKIRKQDVHHPKGKFFGQKNVERSQILKTSVTKINPQGTSSNLTIFIPGGAFISGPGQHHWDSVKTIAQATGNSLWLCDYPKAPEHKILEISDNIDRVYQAALEEFPAAHISLIGDSAGGTLIAALTQRLIQKNSQLPKQIVLVSPVMDASMSNPAIDEIEQLDPMLSKLGVRSAKKMCAGKDDLGNVMISPINGNFKGFPKTIMFVAAHDVTYPDQLLAIQKLTAAGVDVEVVTGENMPHIWPFLPVMKEAKLALSAIIEKLNN